MTGGRGIAHSEVSTPGTTVLHGAQLWVALPDAHRNAPEASSTTPRARSPVDGATAAGLPRHPRRPDLAGRRPSRRCSAPRSRSTPRGDGRARARRGIRARGARRHAGARPSTARTVASAATWPTSPRHRTLDAHQRRTTSRARCCCSAGRRSRRRSSCGGTSWAAATRRSSRPARSGWRTPTRFGAVDGYAGEVKHLPAPAIPAVRIRPRSQHFSRTRDA